MISKPILRGKLITLRPLTKADAQDMFAALSDEESMRLTGTQASYTLEQVEAFCERIANSSDRVDYAITLKDNPRYIGEVVLNNFDVDNRSASFRIALNNQKNFGKGYGSEATKLMLKHAFENLHLHRVELEVYDFNPRAKHVYEKQGFTQEGIKRDTLLWNGKYQNAIIMSLLEDEYFKQTI